MPSVIERRRRWQDFYRAHREWTSSLLLLPVCCYFALNRGEYTLVDSADLVIHEAGHFFFRFFGRFILYAGGTLMQLLLPGLLVWHFWRHGYRLGVQLSMLWLGQNLINVSVYAADARARRLPLLGGDIGEHDWWNLLRMVDLLAYDQVIGTFFFAGALLVFAMLLAVPRFLWD